MPGVGTWLVLLLFATASISIALAVYAWRRQPAAGSTHYTVLMLAIGQYSLAYAFELASTDLVSKIFWAKAQALGIVLIPVAWFAFTLEFTGRDKWLARRNLILLLIIPVASLALVWTNELHNLMWSDAVLNTSGLVPTLALTLEAGAWFYGTYDALLTLLGIGFLFQAFLRASHPYRGQIGVLLLAALLPSVGDASSTLGMTPFPNFDLTPFAFTLSGLLMAWGLFRFRLLDLVPVARDTVIESMGDGVLVLDTRNRIVDLNPSAQTIIDLDASRAIGKPAEQILLNQFCNSPENPAADSAKTQTRSLAELQKDSPRTQIEIVVGKDEKKDIYELGISRLTDRRNRLTGRLIVLRDITERKQAEAALRKAHDELEVRILERTRSLALANEALQEQIVEREQAEKRLCASLQEKELLLKEIHHRVKNNLQIVSSLLYLQSRDTHDKRTLEALKKSEDRIYSLAAIHEELYRSRDLEQVSFAHYTQRLLEHLFLSYDVNPQSIVPKTMIPDVVLDIDTSIMCGLIINELISNALKHAFPGGRAGEICVGLYSDNNLQWILTVSDNGVGLPPDVQVGQGDSLGLKLVTLLARQLEGRLEVDRSTGTRYTITWNPQVAIDTSALKPKIED